MKRRLKLRKVYVFENRDSNPRRRAFRRIEKGQFFYMEEPDGDLVVDYEDSGRFIHRATGDIFETKDGDGKKTWGVKCKAVA